MSNLNRIIPLILVTGVGIWNGMYVFKPAFEEQKEQKDKTFEKQHGGLESGEPKESATQDLGAKTPGADVGVQKAAEILSQQTTAAKDASGSNSWFKGWGLAWPGSKANSEAEQSKYDAPKPLGPQPSTRKTQEKSEN
ncbi:hypothetical protein DIS24_g9781 [Lasiodiplodia hormozganensis]|uniref:Uncharacterized protein n=1 Tax=Lasiodiplodia hormozganensis TaxID=869390 RepID=A0AA39XTK7_9PEZI|nr:hypothetical protein DIS24_g9781 [Lasiodiplodia hormozganensis]